MLYHSNLVTTACGQGILSRLLDESPSGAVVYALARMDGATPKGPYTVHLRTLVPTALPAAWSLDPESTNGQYMDGPFGNNSSS